MKHITNGTLNFTVSAGAFKSIFMPLGYREVTSHEKVTPKNAAEEAKEETCDITHQSDSARTDVKSDTKVPTEKPSDVKSDPKESESNEDLAEKPLSEMTEAELRQFAKLNEIDVSKVSGIDKLREKIHKELN